MKKRIISVALCLCLLAVAAMGTIAYFTDTDSAQNVFTTGNVAIDLYEDFGSNSGTEKLLPATGSAQNDTLKNGIEKEVYVKNTGSEEAYVRVHIAIPEILDNGDPTFDASANVLHFNYEPETIGEGKWDWSKSATDNKYQGDWNFYKTPIGGKTYNVYVVTYTSALQKNVATVDAMDQVYLDSKVTNEDITRIKNVLGDQWSIYVVAEGAQKEGFENAYDALNTAFGIPGTYTVKWDAVAEGDKFVEVA